MKKSLLFLIGSMLLLVQCSPKADIALGPATTTKKEASTKGPQLDGEWASDCIESQWGASYGKRILTFRFSGQEFQQSETSYSDARCAVATRHTELKGTFGYVRSRGNGVFSVKYIIPIDKNSWTWRYQNLSVETNSIRITDFDTEEERLEKVLPQLSLKPKVAFQQPLNPPVQQVPPPQAPKPAALTPVPNSASLQSGLYKRTAGEIRACDQVVSTMEVNGVVQTVYVDVQRPCTAGTITLNCQGPVCESSRYSLKILGDKSYEFNSTVGSWTATYTFN